MTDIAANIALLERKFGRALPDSNFRDQKVTLTISALLAIVQATRDEERRDAQLKANSRKAENVEAVLDRALDILKGKR